MLETILLFVLIGSLPVKVCFQRVKNLVVDIIRSIPFIDRYILGAFPKDRQMIPWLSNPVPIFTKAATVRRRLPSSTEPSRYRRPQHDVVVWIAREITIEPSAETRVTVLLLLTAYPLWNLRTTAVIFNIFTAHKE